MSLHVCVNTVWPGFAPASAAARLEPSSQVDARGEVYAEASITNERNGKQRSIHARWMERVRRGRGFRQFADSALGCALQRAVDCCAAIRRLRIRTRDAHALKHRAA